MKTVPSLEPLSRSHFQWRQETEAKEHHITHFYQNALVSQLTNQPKLIHHPRRIIIPSATPRD